MYFDAPLFLVLFQTVGAAAKQSIIRNAQNTVCHVKRILGRPFDDAMSQEFIASCPVKVSW